jgi:hypothetical protein
MEGYDDLEDADQRIVYGGFDSLDDWEDDLKDRERLQELYEREDRLKERLAAWKEDRRPHDVFDWIEDAISDVW